MKKIFHASLLTIIMLLSPSVFCTDNAAEDVAMEAVDAAFSELERQIITGYYGDKSTGMETGKRKKRSRDDGEDEDDDDDDYDVAKKDRKEKKDKDKKKDKKDKKRKELPPGIAKKLERGGQLPPGIAKRYLPEDLEGKLPTVKEGFERIESEGKVMLVEAATGIIVDVIDTVMKPDKPAVGKNRVTERNKSSDEMGEPEKKWWQFWK